MPDAVTVFTAAFAEELEQLYQASWARMSALLSAVPRSTVQAFRMEALIAQIDAEMASLNIGISEWASRSSSEGYRFGANLGLQRIASFGQLPDRVPFDALIHSQAVAVIADQIVVDALASTFGWARNLKRYVRETQVALLQENLVNRAIAQGIIEGQTHVDVSSRILNLVRDSVTDANKLYINGRNYDPRKYARLLALTRTREAVTQGTLNTAIEYGMDLVQVSDHSHPQDDACSPYKGKVFSISGANKDFPKMSEKPPFHPHCRHILLPVSEDILKVKGIYEELSRFSKAA